MVAFSEYFEIKIYKIFRNILKYIACCFWSCHCSWIFFQQKGLIVASIPLMQSLMILIVSFLKYFKIFRKKYFEIYCLLFLFDCSFNIVPGSENQDASECAAAAKEDPTHQARIRKAAMFWRTQVQSTVKISGLVCFAWSDPGVWKSKLVPILNCCNFSLELRNSAFSIH